MQTLFTINHGKLEDWNNGMMDFRNILIDGLVKSLIGGHCGRSEAISYLVSA